MNRILLVLALLAAGLLVASRVTREPHRAPEPAGPVAGPTAARIAPPAPAAPPPVAMDLPAGVPTLPPPNASAGTPIIARLARIESRRRLVLAGTATYLDSLFSAGDSTVRRWDDRAVIRVAMVAAAGETALVDAARSGLRFWERLGLGISFVDVADSTGADIVVEWIDQFDAEPAAGNQPGRTGLTAIRSTEHGMIDQARITLARSDTRGAPLGIEALRGIAIHEFGHALGLPHSGRRDDIMYPMVVASQLSIRDRSTAALLYSLPPGPLREPTSP